MEKIYFFTRYKKIVFLFFFLQKLLVIVLCVKKWQQWTYEKMWKLVSHKEKDKTNDINTFKIVSRNLNCGPLRMYISFAIRFRHHIFVSTRASRLDHSWLCFGSNKNKIPRYCEITCKLRSCHMVTLTLIHHQFYLMSGGNFEDEQKVVEIQHGVLFWIYHLGKW
jgi:hypothetical protein